MILMRVLGLKASHLLLIRTNLGYGAVLTAACARQSWSANGFFVVVVGLVEASHKECI
jgi:hypothetical protein